MPPHSALLFRSFCHTLDPSEQLVLELVLMPADHLAVRAVINAQDCRVLFGGFLGGMVHCQFRLELFEVACDQIRENLPGLDLFFDMDDVAPAFCGCAG